MRYVGQSFELSILWDGNLEKLRESFISKHHTEYGFASKTEPMEIIAYLIGYVLTVAVLYFFVSASSERDANVGWAIACGFIAIFWPVIVVPGIGIWIARFIRRRVE